MIKEVNLYDKSADLQPLKENGVVLLYASLQETPARLRQLFETLSPDEVKRANRYKFPIHHDRFIISRGTLREILSAYTGNTPAEIQFDYEEHGKPHLKQGLSDLPIQFNISDSHDLAVYAFTLNKAIGVDVEWIRDNVMSAELVERFFAKEESMMLQALPLELRQQAFFNGWARKEAFLKAIGKGLSFPLNQFIVTLAPGEPAEILSIQNDKAAAREWQLFELEVMPGYVGALVVRS